MVLREPFPPDIRVRKEADALLGAGHDVYLLAGAPHGGVVPRDELVGGIHVRRVPRRPWGLWQLAEVWFHLTFKDRRWRRAIAGFERDFELDVLHVHDLPLVKEAVTVALRAGIPVVADFHENYPAAIQEWKRRRHPVIRWLLAAPRRWETYERWACGAVDHLIVVVEEARQRLVRELGVKEAKITVVGNTTDPASVPDIGPPASGGAREAFLLLYVGGEGPHRGLETLIEAMAHLKKSAPMVRLRLVGLSPSGEAELRLLAERLGVSESVELVRWQPMERVWHHIAESDVCVIPHRKSRHTDSTIPHKLFQYMAAGRPVLVSNCAPLERIVTSANAGVVFCSGDASDLANRVCELYADQDVRECKGRNGHGAAAHGWSWMNDRDALHAIYAGRLVV
jgi:glycosyltransferase involved in cell wall biosynthesis